MSAPRWRAHAGALVMPGTAGLAIPALLGGWHAPVDRLGDGMLIAGVVVALGGWALVAWTVTLFVVRGRGTLAPWNPTRRLVIDGPFAHVRNPMITGVAIAIGGAAIALRSAAVGEWLLVFVAVNHTYFVLSEEPGLRRRFGPAYEEYAAAVPRWWPRATRYRPTRSPVGG